MSPAGVTGLGNRGSNSLSFISSTVLNTLLKSYLKMLYEASNALGQFMQLHSISVTTNNVSFPWLL